MTSNSLKIIPLGGLGAIGKNMMALEFGPDIVIIDAGILFPEENMPGVDFAIPDITYLIDNKEKVKALLITHGHEDHIGAIPYILPELNIPIYASRLTHGLITVKLREHGKLSDARLNVIEPNSPFKIGQFEVEFFRVCHSIPDAMGIAVTTPLGIVVHTGDFKIDHTPVDGKTTDFSTLSRLSSQGVLLLCSDSTYAEVEGYTPSEQIVGEALDRAIGDAGGRVIVATFASLISRMQQVINAATKHNRKITIVGRSMVNNLKMATKMGYLNVPDGTIIPIKEASKLQDHEIVIMATGAQGEPTSALVRISNGEHQDIEIINGDTVVISSSPIPGNETLISKTIDNLSRQGAKVLYSRTALVHVHGHGSREELKMILSLVKPKFFLPVHGEYRHLVAHASIAQSTGVPESNTFVLEDGDVLELETESGIVGKKVKSGHKFVGGKRIWEPQDSLLKERKKMAREGIIIVIATVDKITGKLINPPDIVSKGFMEINDNQELFKKTVEETQNILEIKSTNGLNWNEIEIDITKSISDFIYNQTRRRPKVIARIEKISL